MFAIVVGKAQNIDGGVWLSPPLQLIQSETTVHLRDILHFPVFFYNEHYLHQS